MAEAPDQEVSDRFRRLEETVGFLQHEHDELSGEIAGLHRLAAELRREIERLKQAAEARTSTESGPGADAPAA